MLKREKPNALVSSLSLPDKDGYWLIREVRNLPPDQGGDVPAAAFTGWTTVEDQRNALRARFQVHISKPADLRKLAEIVAFLSQKSTRPVLSPPGNPFRASSVPDTARAPSYVIGARGGRAPQTLLTPGVLQTARRGHAVSRIGTSSSNALSVGSAYTPNASTRVPRTPSLLSTP